jgi:hypothetical protein
MIRMRIAFALFAFALVMPMMTRAQEIDPQLTPGTACGEPGVGLVRKIADGAERWVAESRNVGTPGQYVGKSGRWLSGCQMPPACEARATYEWAEQIDNRDARCAPSVPEIRAAKTLGTIRQIHAIGPGGAIIGRATYECTPEGWRLRPHLTYCRRGR